MGRGFSFRALRPSPQGLSIDLMNELEIRDAVLRREADDFLARHGILRILEGFGMPHVSGSYELELMTWRDLDIYVEVPAPDRARFLELGLEMGRALLPRKLSFTDHLNFPATEPVIGLYWGIQTDHLERGGWKLDIWGVTPEVCAERLRHGRSLRSRMTPETRLAILAIKDEVCRLPGYRKTITSQDIYDAVLERGLKTAREFLDELKGSNRYAG
jgi:hypothetical protein